MNPTTFHEIERAKGTDHGASDEQSPLSDWYARVRDVPLSAFGVEDLCKSVRQDLYPEYVVPVALEALEKEPLAGDMYDGELAVSFRSVSETFWRDNPVLAKRLLRVLKDVLPRLGDDLKADASTTIARIKGLTNKP